MEEKGSPQISISHRRFLGPVGEEIALDADLPQYVIRGSEEESNWKKRNPDGYKLHTGRTVGANELHKAALQSDVEEVRRLLKTKGHMVNVRDINGWMPLHVSCEMLSPARWINDHHLPTTVFFKYIKQESVRQGDVESVELMLDFGADVNARTKGQEAGASGGTPLWWAFEYHNDDHPVVQLLKRHGGRNIAPHEH